MAGGLREQHGNLVSASAYICDAITMFESVRRRVYGHVGWDYPIVTPGMETRSAGLLWCTLVAAGSAMASTLLSPGSPT